MGYLSDVIEIDEDSINDFKSLLLTEHKDIKNLFKHIKSKKIKTFLVVHVKCERPELINGKTFAPKSWRTKNVLKVLSTRKFNELPIIRAYPVIHCSRYDYAIACLDSGQKHSWNEFPVLIVITQENYPRCHGGSYFTIDAELDPKNSTVMVTGIALPESEIKVIQTNK